jgi:hypothetical protein
MNSITVNFENSAEMNLAYKQLRKQYPKNRIVKTDIDIAEMVEDEYLFALAMDREKYGSGNFYSETEIMLELGITEQDIEEAEDLEIE